MNLGRLVISRLGRLALIGATAAIVVSAGGCSAGNQEARREPSSSEPPQASEGQSLDAARAQLKSVAGLTDTAIEVDDTVSGLNKHHQVLVEGTADDAGTLPDLIDYLAQLAWSVNEEEPDTGVYIRLALSPQPVIGDVAKANGWTDAAYSSSTDRLKQLVLLPESAVQDRFGAWPGAVPDAMS